MRSTIKVLGPAAAIAGLLTLSAQPLIQVWQAREATPVADIKGMAVPAAETAATFNLPDEFVVDLKDGASEADIRNVAAEYGIQLIPNSITAKANKLMRATAPVGVSEAELIARLKSDPRVEVAEDDQIYTLNHDSPELHGPHSAAPPRVEVGMPGMDQTVPQYSAAGRFTLVSSTTPSDEGDGEDSFQAPNDPRYKEQWNFQMIGAESAWKRARGKGIVVAVIDTGVAAGPVKKGTPCRDFNQTRFVAGYDFVNDTTDAWDDHGHGTHVAGTIAESTNNNEGVAGLAFDATIMPLKVLSAQGSGTAADIADAIRFAADKGAHVINMSLGSSMPSEVIHKACKYAAKKGVVIVCAAGNGFGSPVGYPAAFPECIAVSSVGPSGDIAKYSSYGKEVALAAPGGDMVESRNPSDGILQNTYFPESQGGKGDDYYAFQGTSMASPHVAAAAALIMSQGETDAARVRDILVKSVTPKNDKNKYGAGILNVAQATAKTEQLQQVKLRHVLALMLTLPILLIGPSRRFGLRLLMLGGLWAGFFGPDLFASWVGADSALNMVVFSALLPMAAYALLRNVPAVKAAGTFALGTAVNLYANWHNDTLPFTTATFGEAGVPWTAVNLVLALTIGMLAARRAFRATN